MDFQKKVIFGENGRAMAAYKTKSSEEVKEKKELGWTATLIDKAQTYYLRSPDTWLVDLTDFFKVNYYGNPIVNLAYYLFLTNKYKNNALNDYINYIMSKKPIYYKNFQYVVVFGIVLETEVRLLGSDNRLNNLKKDIFSDFYKSSYFKQFYSRAQKMFKGSLDFGSMFDKEGERNDLALKLFKEKVPDSENINFNFKIIDGLIPQLPEYDYLMLIPKSGYKYLSSVVDKDNYDKILFWEIHANTSIKSQKNFNFNIKGKKVLVIDNIYSGKTMSIITELITKKGGIPITMGLFPKSFHSALGLDYFVIYNKVFCTKDFKYKKNWAVDSFVNVMSEVINAKKWN